jgi:hypothetical protein
MTANVTPTPSQMLAALQSPYYGMVFLGLASQAYTAQADWNEIPQGLYNALTQTRYTPQLPGLNQPGVATPAPIPGSWSLDWGPANGADGSGDNSNLLYIASYRAKGNPNYADGSPYFFAVGIRGTDTSVHGDALWQQIFQDIRDFTLWSWPNLLSGEDGKGDKTLLVPTPNTLDISGISGNVAHGSMLGFVKLANFTAPLNNGLPPSQATGPSLTVMAALNQLLTQYPRTPVVVTGHSLGAALTQLMSAYLAWQLGPSTTFNVPVIPQAFAPPTAGDQDFITTYQALCPNSFFWYNAYDVVPFAYITMDGGKSGLDYANHNLWTAYKWPAGSVTPQGKNISGQSGPHLPDAMRLLIDGFANDIPKTYRRPTVGVLPLDGVIQQPQVIEAFLLGMGGKWATTDPTTPDAQLAWQHFPPAYFKQMAVQYGKQLAIYVVTPYKPHPTSDPAAEQSDEPAAAGAAG